MYTEFYYYPQCVIKNTNGNVALSSTFAKPCADTEVSEFKPTWLVRVSDFKIVPGSSVQNHYWALSYSWNQSGEIIHNGGEDYQRHDDGKHRVIDLGAPMIRSVKFEELIQLICQKVGVEYIWYDQMCIDQNNHDAKVHEIRRMNLIYKNACCTLALIPELMYRDTTTINVIPDSQWSKRMWTLEEAYMSKSILFVGKDAHLFSDTIKTGGVGKTDVFLRNLQNRDKWRACTTLWYARSRTSHKIHDRVFALVNILPELKDAITISYRQDPLDLMLQFYEALVQLDITVLLFGDPIEPVVDKEITATRQKYDELLPSWTGVRGAHITQEWLVSEHASSTYRLAVRRSGSGSLLVMTSDFALVCIEAAASVEKLPITDNNTVEYTDNGLPSTRPSSHQRCIVNDNSKALTFVTTTEESRDVYNSDIRRCGIKVTHILPLKAKNQQVSVNTLSRPTHHGGYLSLTEDCSECIILFGLTFQVLEFSCHPVIKKVGDTCKSIGLCLIDDYVNIDSAAVKPAQTFKII